jgi:protein-disulfide isomerase
MPFMPPRKKSTIEPILEPAIEPEYIDEPVIEQDDTVTFKRSHFYAALTVLAFAAGVLVGYVAWGTGSAEQTAQSAQAASQPSGQLIDAPVTAQPQYTRYDIPTEGSYSLGPSDAPITIVEFSDFQCPYCRRWHAETYKPLLAAYPGKIRIVYRHLPLVSIHPDAFPAAEAAMCAGDQNVFWQYHDKLFSSESLGNAVYEQYARELSLDIPTFVDCITEHKFQEAIQTDSDFAVNLGIRSTPTFFVNGLAIVGAQPLDVFKQVIDKELAGEIP